MPYSYPAYFPLTWIILRLYLKYRNFENIPLEQIANDLERTTATIRRLLKELKEHVASVESSYTARWIFGVC
ncbi:HTH domain-containing protein [Ammoniphilus sp. 3BR4]|uniref:HTH domain-containing protein n=1 Tax=Ammoniphilus sp. 3BR4 TaxID=3158265 RepID=UPI003465EF9F